MQKMKTNFEQVLANYIARSAIWLSCVDAAAAAANAHGLTVLYHFGQTKLHSV